MIGKLVSGLFVFSLLVSGFSGGCTSGDAMCKNRGVIGGAAANACSIAADGRDISAAGVSHDGREATDYDRANYGDSDSAGERINRLVYQGLLPSASGSGIVYRLAITCREHSGDGRFCLALTYKGADHGRDSSFTCEGRRFTLRGTPEDGDATVWQCVGDSEHRIFNLLKESDSTLILLNRSFERPRTQQNYRLTRIE